MEPNYSHRQPAFSVRHSRPTCYNHMQFARNTSSNRNNANGVHAFIRNIAPNNIIYRRISHSLRSPRHQQPTNFVFMCSAETLNSRISLSSPCKGRRQAAINHSKEREKKTKMRRPLSQLLSIFRFRRLSWNGTPAHVRRMYIWTSKWAASCQLRL